MSLACFSNFSFLFVCGSLMGTYRMDKKPQTKYKQANPRTAPCQPSDCRMAWVICVVANIAIDDADATIAMANERHVSKCLTTTRMDELKIVNCPNPEKSPYVGYIIQISRAKEATEKPSTPNREPTMAAPRCPSLSTRKMLKGESAWPQARFKEPIHA